MYGQKNCLQQQGKECEEIRTELGKILENVENDRANIESARQSTPRSLSPKKSDIDAALMQSDTNVHSEQSDSKGLTVASCKKNFRASHTALKNLEAKIPGWAAVRANCPSMEGIAAGQLVILLYSFLTQEIPFVQTQSLLVAIPQVTITALLAGYASDFVWAKSRKLLTKFECSCRNVV